MLSFHNDPAIKAKYLARIQAHAKADAIVQGTGWENGHGGAVGCTFEVYDHSRGPVEIGAPEWLMHLEDRIFEGLPANEARLFPAQFLDAMPIGKDLEPIRWKLALSRHQRDLDRLANNKEPYAEQVRAAVIGVMDFCQANLKGEFSASAAASAAESAAWSAARSAAWSAESAARSAESAARSAARSAAESAARSAASAAWSAAWQWERDTLLSLLREA